MPAMTEARYSKLLARTRPMVIETEKEYERLLAEVAKLMHKGEDLSPEEDKILALLARLIEDYEDKRYQLKASTPHSVLKSLMDARGLHAKDLWTVFGSKGIASEVLSGKRGVSKGQAKRLAEFLHVSADLFI